MSRIRVYINPKNDAGDFTGYREVTQDLVNSSFSNITEKIDSDEYNVGIFSVNSLNIKLRNDHGLYSDVENVESMFRDRRGGSKVQFRWHTQDSDSICGVAILGSVSITPELIVYDGVLNDDATRQDVDDQEISFRVLGETTIFDESQTPFSSLSNGDLFSEALLTILNQADITKTLIVDALNFDVGLDLAIDDVLELENTTVREALDIILFNSNSVLYTRDNTIFIDTREGSPDFEYFFVGQASNNGIEDIEKLSDLSTGRNLVFNFWTWAGTTLKSTSSTSIAKSGTRKKEISSPIITDIGKRNSILDAQRDEFSTLKEEFKITTLLNYETLALKMLDRVSVDYPSPLSEGAEGEGLPLYGAAVYGESHYPVGQFQVVIDKDTPYKIMGRKIDHKNKTIIFKLEAI